jgi:ADP-ribosylglycohydrolase
MGSYEEAIWETLAAGGDMDTNAAIVGAIVVLAAGRDSIPREWLDSREDLR